MENTVILNTSQREVYDNYSQKASNIVTLLSKKATTPDEFATLKANVAFAEKELKQVKESRMELSRPIKEFADSVLAMPEKDLEKAIKQAQESLASFDEFNKILDSFKRNRINLIDSLLNEYRLQFKTMISARNLANIDDLGKLTKTWKPKFSDVQYTAKISNIGFRAIYNNATEMLANWLLEYPFEVFYEQLLDACESVKEEALSDIEKRKEFLILESEKPTSFQVKEIKEEAKVELEQLKQSIATPYIADTNKYEYKGRFADDKAFLRGLAWYFARKYTRTKVFDEVAEKVINQLIKEGFLNFEGLETEKILKK